MKRSRSKYFILILFTIVVGMASRKFPQFFTPFLANYLGDTLWALTVYWVLGFIFPVMKIWRVAAFSLLFSYSIEVSQLYHSPWIDAIRSNTVGALILGHGFLWSDLICYTVGVAIGVTIELFMHRRSMS